MQLAEWYMFQFLPFNGENLKLLGIAAPHQSFLPIGSEVPIAKKSSFPPGGSQGVLTFSVYALVGIDEQSTRHTSTPKGRFVLRADSIRPYAPYSGLCVQPGACKNPRSRHS